MVEKWDASFNRIGHFHSVTEKNKQIVGKTGLRPKIERLVKRMAAGQLTGDIDVLEETRRLVEGAGAFCEFVREHRVHFQGKRGRGFQDRKSTRLNSSHQIISYAVFCLKKKKIRRYYQPN